MTAGELAPQLDHVSDVIQYSLSKQRIIIHRSLDNNNDLKISLQEKFSGKYRLRKPTLENTESGYFSLLFQVPRQILKKLKKTSTAPQDFDTHERL